VKRRAKKAQRPAGGKADGLAAPRFHDWNTVRCRLLWCYRNTPTTITGSFETMNFILWHLLEGEVEVTSSGPPLRAGQGSWMVLVPGLGRRTQSFSPDARIISLHFSAETGPARWEGPSATVLPDDPELMAAAEALEQFTHKRHPRGVTPGGPILAIESYEEQIEAQEKTWGFWRRFAQLLAAADIVLRAPDLTHPVMARSMALIESWPLATEWNRHAISQVVGVSASQLDRIWRHTCGQTPFQYWSHRRLLYACSQLQGMERGVKEIAYDLGFAHLSQFSNWFRRQQHTSPRTYRETFSG
jgi:AraC-like DNA-binding protein